MPTLNQLLRGARIPRVSKKQNTSFARCAPAAWCMCVCEYFQTKKAKLGAT